MNEQIEKQRDLITKKLRQEFGELDTAFIWTEINELIYLELNYEEEFNK